MKVYHGMFLKVEDNRKIICWIQELDTESVIDLNDPLEYPILPTTTHCIKRESVVHLIQITPKSFRIVGKSDLNGAIVRIK